MEILRRDVQVLDHISAMEIKTHFILNFNTKTDCTITTANAWATRPPLPFGFTGGRVTLIRNMISVILKAYLKYDLIQSDNMLFPIVRLAFWYLHAVNN